MPSRNSYGPDEDSEFTFGPRSIYVEDVESKDGVSAYTDYSSVIRRQDFEPVMETDRKSKPEYASVASLHRPPPPRASAAPPPPPRASAAPPPAPRRLPPPGDELRSSTSSQEFQDRKSVERFSDEHQSTDGDEDRPETYVSRVSEWYNEMEAQSHQDEQDRKSLVASTADGRSVDRTMTVQSQRSERSKRAGRKTMWIIMLVCCILFFMSAALAVGIILLITKVLNDDDSSPKVLVITEPPSTSATLAPSATPSPTPSAVPGELPLVLIETFGGPTSYGSTVSMDADWIAIGSPSTNSGMVSTLFNDGSTWRFVPELSGTDNSAFGASIDIASQPGSTEAYLVVGSPESVSNTEGRAHFYTHDSTSNSWQLQGDFLAGSPTGSATSENFGSSVAVSRNRRVVVGAPDHDLQGQSSGRIYTYEYDLRNGVLEARNMVPTEPILGQGSLSRFGEDVDITKDGEFIVVSEPGMRSFTIFNWDGNVWLKIYQHSDSEHADFGSSVTFLSNNYVAVGAPSVDGNRGLIQVYKVDEDDMTIWNPLPVLEGNLRGDRFGTIGTVSGQEGPTGPEVVLGTANGAVERYDLIGNRWFRRYSVDRPAAVTAVSSYNTDDGYRVLVGHSSSNEALLYAGRPENVIQPSPAPAPTTSRPTIPKTWQQVGARATSSSRSSKDTKFGQAVALVGDYLAVGEPFGTPQEIGDVAILGRSRNWDHLSKGFAVGTLEFGYAVDAALVDGKPSLLVGAPETLDQQGLNVNLGSAHFYQQDISTGNWSTVGNFEGIRPPFLVTEADGKFGRAVAMASDVLRVAIGSPSSSINQQTVDTGKVHTYEFDGRFWAPMGGPLVGSEKDNFLGSSIAMSKSGDRMLVGAPGHRNGDGGVFYYGWNGTDWRIILPLRGRAGSSESLGESVAILSDDGRRIAFGGSTYEGNKGVVKIYEEMGSSGFFVQLGDEDIIGDDGDEIGMTLAGANGRLCFGTANGSFRAYEYNSDMSRWDQIAEGPNLGSAVVSISMSDDGNTVAVGLENQEVTVYELA